MCHDHRPHFSSFSAALLHVPRRESKWKRAYDRMLMRSSNSQGNATHREVTVGRELRGVELHKPAEVLLFRAPAVPRLDGVGRLVSRWHAHSQFGHRNNAIRPSGLFKSSWTPLQVVLNDAVHLRIFFLKGQNEARLSVLSGSKAIQRSNFEVSS